MTTRLPPPKRQKIYLENDKNRPPTPPVESAPNVVVQFVSEENGETPMGDVVNIPSGFSREALELLANKQANEASLFKLIEIRLIRRNSG